MTDLHIVYGSGEIKTYESNPKLIGSNIIDCIPQVGKCPNYCKECYFNVQGFFWPKNKPLIPSLEEVGDKIVRVNSGNDSNNQRDLVIQSTSQYEKKFYNTSIPKFNFPGPVVFTCNRDDDHADIVDDSSNIMMVRFRSTPWNQGLLSNVVQHYVGEKQVPVTITYMRFRNMNNIPREYHKMYDVRIHVVNSWAILKPQYQVGLSSWYRIENDENKGMVGTCGTPESSLCKDCGRCEWAYERICTVRDWEEAIKSTRRS